MTHDIATDSIRKRHTFYLANLIKIQTESANKTFETFWIGICQMLYLRL